MTVEGELIFRFAKFEGGKDDCMFPYCREVIFMVVGQVEKVGEVANAQRTNMLEFVNGVSICTRCSGVRTEADGILNVGGSEDGACVFGGGVSLLYSREHGLEVS